MVLMQRVFSVLLTLIILTLTLHANEHYLLPEDKSNLIRTLKLKIERANTITIITQRFDSNTLSHSIEKRLLANARLLLITTDVNTASYYAKYKNTQIKVPHLPQLTELFTLNLLLIDKSDICFSSLPFDEAILKRNIGQVICTTDTKEIGFGEEIIQKFLERFEAY